MATVKTHFGKLKVQEGIVPGDFTNIPIIDLTTLESPDLASRRALAVEIHDACTLVGFFYIKNHGIPSENIAAIHSAAHDFFVLPHEQKMEYYLGKSNRYHGYSPLSGEHSDKELFGDQTNLSESFDIGYEIAGDPSKSVSEHELPDDPFELYGGNQWPDDSVLPGFHATYLTYFRACVSLSRRLLKIFALALDLDEVYFDEFVTYPGCMSRILHYPPQSVKGEERVGIEAHTDFECFTILSQDTVPALQVLNSSNQWVTAMPIPDTLVVNVGDFMSFWTGGKFRSTVHRATNLTGENRYSVPFFFGVNYDAMVEVLPTCAANEGVTRKAVKAGQYVRDRLSKSYIGFGETADSV
ncbi:2OG-Fe(II) oxygenase family oxidoreductase [Aspergillus pseudoustus]|uniref:2OG-Fe(II) oxygenase family oxidoreductase n=1 Tax=Aspergillus pseudoustus TaxID=1810923 RepID=A0ABR4IKM5_9EURO